MRDEALIEPCAIENLEEDFIDGFTDYEVEGEMLLFVSFRWRRIAGERVKMPIRRFAMPVSALETCRSGADSARAAAKRSTEALIEERPKLLS